MRCYYEVLEVDREADDGEIKTAYRKLALKWHPDKNLDDTTTAKDQFQLVQQAYEVLSDRQERAWYDKHREQILRGANSEFKNDDLDIYQYFTTSCYKGYGDDDNGFYAVYRGVFEQLAKDDMEYMDSKEEFCTIPTFGMSLSDYEDIVGPFYDYWMSYSTKKSYVWLDPHDIREAPNRRILKLIEKENDKVRQKAKKERNEEVRGLVAFVRKRDKRVQSYVKQLEAKKYENREKQQRLSKQKRLERIEQLNASGSQAEWMNFDNVKSQLEEVEKNLAEQFGDAISDEEESLSEEDVSDLYCIACNKMFKNPKALANHELSKKHKENVENLKEVMLEQATKFEEEFEEKNECEDDLDEELDEDISFHSSFEELPVEKTKKKNKKSKTVLKVASVSDHELSDNVANNISEPEDNSESVLFNKRPTKKKNKKNKAVFKTEPDTDHQLQNDVLNLSEDDGNSSCFSNNKKLKRKRRKEKQQLDEMAVNSKSSDCNTDRKVKAQPQETDLDKDHCCVKCKAQFASKNKLFEHLKKTGHSTYLPSTNREAIQKTNKKIQKERIK